jgi:hypothetical protein
MKEKDEAVNHVAQVQEQLDAALLENSRLHTFMEEIGCKLIKGPSK